MPVHRHETGAPATVASPTHESDQKHDLKDQFIARFGAEAETEPSLLKAIGQPVVELEATLVRVQEGRSGVPDAVFTPDERDRYAGKRSPGLPQALALLARGMTRFPAVARGLDVTPALIGQALDRDRAASRQINVADMLLQGGENGALIASALLSRLTDDVLAAMRARLRDARTPPGTRTSLSAAFADASRLKDEERQPTGAGASLLRATAGYKQQLTAAQGDAEGTRLIDAYRSAVTAGAATGASSEPGASVGAPRKGSPR